MNGREGWRIHLRPVLLFLIFTTFAFIGAKENAEGGFHPLTFDETALPWAGDDAGGNLMRDEYMAAPQVLLGAAELPKPCGVIVVEVEGCE